MLNCNAAKELGLKGAVDLGFPRLTGLIGSSGGMSLGMGLIAVPGSQNALSSLLFRGTRMNRVPDQPLYTVDLNCHSCHDPRKAFVFNPKAWSDAPASRDFGDQAVCVETAEDPVNLGAGLFPIVTAESQMLRRLNLASDIVIRKTSQAMLSVHDRLE